MKESFLFDYVDEVKFKKLERSLKKYLKKIHIFMS